MALDEHSIIERFFRPLAGKGAFDLRDDAGLLPVSHDLDLVVTTDMIAENVHFLPGDPPETIAQKALRVNLSDLAAKGAKPLAYVLSLGLRQDIDETWLAAFASSLHQDQERFGIGLLGGDTISVAAGPVISITAFGTVAKGKMVHRFGGQPGDALYVSGAIGAGTMGLAILTKDAGPWDKLGTALRDDLVARYRVPEPRIELTPALIAYASAAMDVSDGLVGDCDKLAAASGCTAEIAAERVPFPEGLPVAQHAKILAMLLTGGDDYEILAAVPARNESGFRNAAAAAAVPVTRIGVLAEGAGPTRVLLEGWALALDRRSYVHGRGGRAR